VTPAEIGERLVGLLGEGARATETYGEVTVDVPVQRWVEAVTAARDDPDLDLSYFDWLSGVDELDAGFDVVVHLYSVAHRHRALLRTRVPRTAPVLGSLAPVFPGAAWHERETYEMFGITFTGHPDLKPLLLPDGFVGHPLRKEFVLASRVAKEWPGAREPGESHTGATRRRMRPPGVPDPTEWGPEAAPAQAGEAAPGDPAAADAAPGDTPPPDAAPGRATPGDAAPGGAAPGDAAPGRAAPGRAAGSDPAGGAGA
jgi:NADH-quinone oxidoreductase subunit C